MTKRESFNKHFLFSCASLFPIAASFSRYLSLTSFQALEDLKYLFQSIRFSGVFRHTYFLVGGKAISVQSFSDIKILH